MWLDQSGAFLSACYNGYAGAAWAYSQDTQCRRKGWSSFSLGGISNCNCIILVHLHTSFRLLPRYQLRPYHFCCLQNLLHTSLAEPNQQVSINRRAANLSINYLLINPGHQRPPMTWGEQLWKQTCFGKNPRYVDSALFYALFNMRISCGLEQCNPAMIRPPDSSLWVRRGLGLRSFEGK